MAGIGFRINRLAVSGGIGGGLAAAALGVAVSSGSWICTAASAAVFQILMSASLDAGDMMALQTVLLYSFSLSGLLVSFVSLVTTRLVSDALFDRDLPRIPALLFASLATVSLVALPCGALIFGIASDLDAPVAFLAQAAVVLLSQLWILSIFLTAMRRFAWIITAYGIGVAGAAPVAWLAASTGSLTLAVAGFVVSVGLTVLALLHGVRRDFPQIGPQSWPSDWWHSFRTHYHIVLTGILATGATWVDKWILWYSSGSVAASGHLRMHPLYDTASYLGLLSLIPGLALILVVAETRFGKAFAMFVACCTGRAVLSRIDEARVDVMSVILAGLRILIVAQGAFAFLQWILAPEIVSAAGLDSRGIITFRFVQVGNIFYLLTLYAVMILYYYDLTGRAMLAWAGFFGVSLIVSLATRNQGFEVMGWGYLAGAATGAAIAWVFVLSATHNLVYLLFVGNNPMIRGAARRWA